MNALLHYNVLKGWRDRSLVAFMVIPALVPVAGLVGASFTPGVQLHYPLAMAPHFSAAQNAALIGELASIMCALFSVLPSFWTLRTEIASRSVSSFTMASRPFTVVIMLVIYGASIGYSAWLVSMTFIGILTTALPPHLAFLAFKVGIAALAASAVGALAVTISPEPAVMIGAFCSAFVIVPLFARTVTPAHLIAAFGAALIAIAIAAVLLERRCAR